MSSFLTAHQHIIEANITVPLHGIKTENEICLTMIRMITVDDIVLLSGAS